MSISPWPEPILETIKDRIHKWLIGMLCQQTLEIIYINWHVDLEEVGVAFQCVIHYFI